MPKQYLMSEILTLLGIDYPRGVEEITLECPHCIAKGTANGKRRFCLSMSKGCGQCFSCGFQAGKIEFYAASRGISEAKAKEEIRSRLNEEGKGNFPVIKKQEKDEYPTLAPSASREIRAKTYQAFLDLLNLTDTQKRSLLDRKMNEAEITRGGYKSYPQLPSVRDKIVRQLLSQGYILDGVPGFCCKGGRHHLVSFPQGILIPTRGTTGDIQGMQMRLENPTPPDYEKYLTLSSGKYEGGAKAQTFLHFIGTCTDELWITEGALKADIAYAYSGHAYMAVPGVASLQFVPDALKSFKRRGGKRVIVAYDMDYTINPNVQNHLKTLGNMILDTGLEPRKKIWNPEGKAVVSFDAEHENVSALGIYQANTAFVKRAGIQNYEVVWATPWRWTISYPLTGLTAIEADSLLKKVREAADEAGNGFACHVRLEGKYKGIDDYLVGMGKKEKSDTQICQND